MKNDPEFEKSLVLLADLAAHRLPVARGAEPVAIVFAPKEVASLPLHPPTFSRMVKTTKGRTVVLTRALGGTVIAAKAVAQAGFAGKTTTAKKAKSSAKNGKVPKKI